jgi:hypothetical protein
MKKVNIGQAIYIVRRGKQPSKVFSNAAKMCRAMADRPDFPHYETFAKALQATKKRLEKAAAEAEVDTDNFDVVFSLWRIEVRQVL